MIHNMIHRDWSSKIRKNMHWSTCLLLSQSLRDYFVPQNNYGEYQIRLSLSWWHFIVQQGNYVKYQTATCYFQKLDSVCHTRRFMIIVQIYWYQSSNLDINCSLGNQSNSSDINHSKPSRDFLSSLAVKQIYSSSSGGFLRYQFL